LCLCDSSTSAQHQLISTSMHIEVCSSNGSGWHAWVKDVSENKPGNGIVSFVEDTSSSAPGPNSCSQTQECHLRGGSITVDVVQWRGTGAMIKACACVRAQCHRLGCVFVVCCVLVCLFVCLCVVCCVVCCSLFLLSIHVIIYMYVCMSVCMSQPETWQTSGKLRHSIRSVSERQISQCVMCVCGCVMQLASAVRCLC